MKVSVNVLFLNWYLLGVKKCPTSTPVIYISSPLPTDTGHWMQIQAEHHSFNVVQTTNANASSVLTKPRVDMMDIWLV